MRDIELEDEPGPNLEGKAETLKVNPTDDQTKLMKTSEEPIIIKEVNL